MARIPTFTPRSVIKNKRTYWDLDIPKAFDPNPDADKKKRQRKRYETKTEALNAARRYRNRWRDLGKHGITLTPEQASEAHKAFKLIEDTTKKLEEELGKKLEKRLYLSSVIEDALEGIEAFVKADLKEDYSLTLEKASKHLVEHYKYKEQAHTFEEVYEKSIKARKSRGAWSTSYARDQDWLMKGPKPNSLASDEDRIKEKGFLYHFGSTLIDEISEDQIRDFMNKYYNTNPNTYNYCHGIIHPAFKYARDRGWISVDPMKLIEKKSIQTNTLILTISEFNRCVELMNTEKYQSLAVPLALLMFSGMRRDELKGNKDKTPLEWKRVITNPTGVHTLPYIEISPEQSKGTSARLITIQPNLLKWIETVPESKRVGFIIPSNFDRLMKSFRLEAGIKGKRNIIRHSFGAYHYHSWANQGATMKEMGHTKVSTFMKHYYAWNPEEEAPYLYWRLLPNGAEMDNVVPMPGTITGL